MNERRMSDEFLLLRVLGVAIALTLGLGCGRAALPMPELDAAESASAATDLASLMVVDASAPDRARLCVSVYAVCPDGYRDEGDGLAICDDLGSSRWCVGAP